MRHHSFANWPKPKDPEALLFSDKKPAAVAPGPAATDYSSLLKRELQELAEARGVSISSRDSKQDIIDALVSSDG